MPRPEIFWLTCLQEAGCFFRVAVSVHYDDRHLVLSHEWREQTHSVGPESKFFPTAARIPKPRERRDFQDGRRMLGEKSERFSETRRGWKKKKQRKFWLKRPFDFEVQYREFCYGLLRSLGKICPDLNHSRSTRWPRCWAGGKGRIWKRQFRLRFSRGTRRPYSVTLIGHVGLQFGELQTQRIWRKGYSNPTVNFYILKYTLKMFYSTDFKNFMQQPSLTWPPLPICCGTNPLFCPLEKIVLVVESAWFCPDWERHKYKMFEIPEYRMADSTPNWYSHLFALK